MERWVVLYDGDCGLCKWLLAELLRWDRRAQLEPVALQRERAATLLPDLSPEARLASWHLVAPTGPRYSGGAALPPMLRLLPYGTAPAMALARMPRLTERGYRWVAAHRAQLSRLVPQSSKRRASEFVTEREHAADAGRQL